MKNISSKEFIAKFEKLKKLYDTSILTFTEFTEQKELVINELKNYIVEESKADFLINISVLFQQNYINDEELDKIKKIILFRNRIDITANDIADNKIETLITVSNIKNENGVKIGNQIWLTKNLDTEYYRNGDPIPQVQDAGKWSKLTTGAWCYFDNETSNGNNYGKLYNWYAVNDPRGLAPNGWHTPSDKEWTTLIKFLGGEKVAGGKLKATTSWNSQNTGTTNSSGFTAFPGGCRNAIGNYNGIGKYGTFWSASESISVFAWLRNLYYDRSAVTRHLYSKQNGLSIRCVKD